MRRSFIAVFAMICAAGFLIQTCGARDSKADSAPASFPIVPMNMEFRVVPEFFRQPLTTGSKYSGIDAFVDNGGKNPWYEIILREKASSKQVYYCSSQAMVAMLSGRGEQAFYAPISFKSSTGANSQSIFTFQFQDSSQQAIQWRFVTGSPETGKDGEDRFMARPDDSGFVLLHLHQPVSAAQGTIVSIGDEQNPAGKDAFYAQNVLLADIPPITEEWNVSSAPSQAQAGDKWVLRSKTGSEQQFAVQRVSGDQISLELKNPDSPSTVQLDVRQTEDLYSLNSMAVSAQGHTFRISFDPALPLPAATTNDKTEVKFTMDEDSNVSVASGQVTAVRGLADEHLQWQFASPDWAKSKRLNTGVSVLFGSEMKEVKKLPKAVP